MSHTTLSRVAAGLAASLTIVLGAALAAPAAQAVNPVLDADNRLGGITLDKTSGAISGSGGPQSLTTEAGCPEGYRGSSRVLFVWPDGTWPAANSSSDLGLPALVKVAGSPIEGSGLDGEPINRTGTSASRWAVYGFPADRFDGRSGVATYVITCDPGDAPTTTYPTAASGVGASKYFSVDLRLNWNDETNTGTWEHVKEATTTTLTADEHWRSATLTAEVGPDSATGTVTFENVRTGETVGTGTVTDGVASVTVKGLKPWKTYTFRAHYTGDAQHDGSTSNKVRVNC
ncbi:Ig-like domain-containing protein [Myceligenerans pegani]|uniref:Ig-like domain repeat protein n=1 Tax=Myceligenerans pegani TaxID=2776917 RepID=A0ABR9N1W7_9MICO|nr:Ig-like domain-containing protein [Myceligenerans sp. TRM 65318]MBE1877651.1 Ig-like domain repeat protein [Myceligenerans sp. TRM 65318]MBE3019922.1 Ig-like domain repeat protein [Myceligenerans sp. TRM 65318]